MLFAFNILLHKPTLATLAMMIAVGSILSSCKRGTIRNEQVQDSIIQQSESIIIIDSSQLRSSHEIDNSGQVDDVYVVQDMFSYISDPYDFPLEPDAVKSLLGIEAIVKAEEFKGEESSGNYTVYTITLKETEIRFYDYSGKHFSKIATPLLPLKNGIRIGLTKEEFFKAFPDIDEKTASPFGIIQFTDDFGQMTFVFKADTLKITKGYYEEGD